MSAQISEGERVVVFVDAQHLRSGLLATIPGQSIDYSKLVRKMSEPGTLGRAWFYNAPPPPHMNRGPYDRWVNAISRLPFCEVVQGKIKKRTRQVLLSKTGELEEATYYEQKGVDVKLAIDVIAQIDTYDVAIIATGDADFVGLAKLVRQYNRHVLNAHCPVNKECSYYYSKSLEEACDRPPIVMDKDYLADCLYEPKTP